MAEFPLTDLAYSYLAFAVAYLIGSLSFAVIVSRALRLPDPRTYGSNNPGATNVLRSGHKAAALLTLLFDALKGYLPVTLARHFALEYNFEETTLVFVGVAAFIGHLFPVFFKFQGGKGVATAAGVLLALELPLGLAALVIWLLIAVLFRFSSLASIIAALFAPFFALMFYDSPILAIGVGVMSMLLIWRHWGNITKLMSGRELRIGEKAPEKPRRRRRSHRLPSEPPSSAAAPLAAMPPSHGAPTQTSEHTTRH